ncbi:helix-turn-helix domain-containing protein [Oceanobacter kriegii]|uniref:helix-turn-helix domain-containing protein n=1 Tax=Oceanobacter kriegii TaxID=64972 RepID=UPI00041CF0CF|nr:helix-turn-helix domain-containing protein [Oceanobacter kriegii]
MTAPEITPAIQIPVVHYYGEAASGFSADLMHCEPLSIRSREHQFTIKPHRHHGLTQLFCLTRGSGDANIDGESLEISAPAVMVITELCVHDFLWSHDVEGYVLSLSHSLLAQLDDQQRVLQHTQIIEDEPGCLLLAGYFQGLCEEYQNTADPQRALALGSWLNLLLLTLQRQQHLHQQQHSGAHSQPQQYRASQYLQRFNQLVNRDYARQRTVESYANELGVSAPHLNSLCKQQLGKNALALVHERLTLEASRRLSYTIQPISVIADQLGFADPAYFTRFFKRQTGLSPKQFRQQSEA